MLPLLAGNPPSWVMHDARYDFDFANNRYWQRTGGGLWRGDNSNKPKRSPSFSVYSNSGAAAGTLFTRWKDGILRPTASTYDWRISDYGAWSEGNVNLAHNYALQCRDFTQAVWTLTNITAAHTSVGADGIANHATRLTATNATNSALQVTVIANKLVTTSAWIKRITGTGTVSLTSDNATYTDISGLINSNTYTLVRVPSQTLTNPTVGVQFGTNGDAIDIDFFQTEDGDQATSPVVSAASINLRGPELSCLFGAISDPNTDDGIRILKEIEFGNAVTILVQYSGNFSTSTSHLIWGDDVSNIFLTGAAGGGVVTVTGAGGTYASADSDISGLFTLNKTICRWDGTGSAICINGGTLTKNSTIKFRPTDIGVTHGGTLNIGSNAEATNGYVVRLSFWTKALTDGEMIQYSTVKNNQ